MPVGRQLLLSKGSWGCLTVLDQTLGRGAALRLLPLLLVTLMLNGCLSMRTPLPIGEVVRWSREGSSNDQVASRLREARTSYALRGADFALLAGRGVAPAVLDALQHAGVYQDDSQIDAITISRGPVSADDAGRVLVRLEVVGA